GDPAGGGGGAGEPVAPPAAAVAGAEQRRAAGLLQGVEAADGAARPGDGAVAPGAERDRHTARGRAAAARAGDRAAALGAGGLTTCVPVFVFFASVASRRVGWGWAPTGGGWARRPGDVFQAGRRPPRTRASPSVRSAAAVPQVMAETAGSLKSVPVRTAWRKIKANAA